MYLGRLLAVESSLAYLGRYLSHLCCVTEGLKIVRRLYLLDKYMLPSCYLPFFRSLQHVLGVMSCNQAPSDSDAGRCFARGCLSCGAKLGGLGLGVSCIPLSGAKSKDAFTMHAAVIMQAGRLTTISDYTALESHTLQDAVPYRL